MTRPNYPAAILATAHIERGLEVRITNGGDELVFHAVQGRVRWPVDAQAFWRGIAAEVQR